MIDYWVRLKVRNPSPITTLTQFLDHKIICTNNRANAFWKLKNQASSGSTGFCTAIPTIRGEHLPFGWYWLDFENQIDKVNI
jgi:hypothetical protein